MATDISYLAVANTVCERCSVKDNRCFVVKAAIRNVNGSTNQLEYSCHLYKQDSRFPSVKMRLLIADIAQTEIEMGSAIDGAVEVVIIIPNELGILVNVVRYVTVRVCGVIISALCVRPRRVVEGGFIPACFFHIWTPPVRFRVESIIGSPIQVAVNTMNISFTNSKYFFMSKQTV